MIKILVSSPKYKQKCKEKWRRNTVLKMLKKLCFGSASNKLQIIDTDLLVNAIKELLLVLGII